jgi:hypothetical protein
MVGVFFGCAVCSVLCRYQGVLAFIIPFSAGCVMRGFVFEGSSLRVCARAGFSSVTLRAASLYTTRVALLPFSRASRFVIYSFFYLRCFLILGFFDSCLF